MRLSIDRVIDVWTSYQSHGGGIGGYGIYAYLEPAAADDDRPQKVYPDYYRP